MKEQFVKSLSFIPGLLLVPVVYVASRLLPHPGDEYAYDCEPHSNQPKSEAEPALQSQKTLVTQR